MGRKLDISPVNEIKSLSNMLNRKLNDVLAAAGGEKLNSFQLWIICYIDYCQALGQQVFQKDIEQYFDIRRPTASKLLDMLEEQGFLDRETDDEDRRRKKLILTEKSKAYLAGRSQYLDEFGRQFLYGISHRQLASFMKTLGEMKQNLERIKSSKAKVR
ncbi:MAG: MarR family transcriptional regulator [Sphaerochaetaceae bacterium]|nr:MarR family transcriptional regulator [Sphaerochaetaceae bacterium]